MRGAICADAVAVKRGDAPPSFRRCRAAVGNAIVEAMAEPGSRVVTIDHARIRRWIEAHGGHPAATSRGVRGAAPPALRIGFPGSTDAEFLDPLSWDAFFARFDADGLAFVHEVDEPDERPEPPFFEFVPRGSAAREPRR